MTVSRMLSLLKYSKNAISWTLSVSRTASYEITLVSLSVNVSIFFSSFLKIESLVSSDIIHDDS